MVLLLCSYCESNFFYLDLVLKWLNLTVDPLRFASGPQLWKSNFCHSNWKAAPSLAGGCVNVLGQVRDVTVCDLAVELGIPCKSCIP